ncbi:DegT/DnrJ/EryC1/StrS family aminotransferase [Tunturiibacter gelidiferens]|uniref:DegT/DnrJ/EryC1/StrS family aminotransferase n=1 Tax=Tunturiibacter gelidiferens TaxID=3069689 RepID=UPI003D9BE436
MQKAYSKRRYGPGTFPVTEAAAERIVSLPMYPSLAAPQQRVVEALLAAAHVFSV